MVGSCEDGDEPVGFITCTEFLDQQENSQLLKKASASCCWFFSVDRHYKTKIIIYLLNPLKPVCHVNSMGDLISYVT
jgi:hypothetical protein